MIRPDNIFKTRDGFTIIEIILLILLSALFGTMLFQFAGTSVTRSGEEVVLVQEGYELIGIMEQMAADYDELDLSNDTHLSIFETAILGGNNSSNDPYYGDYEITTAYIQFSGGGVEEPDSSGENNLLKVTITKGSQSLTALFSKTTGG